MTFFESFLIGLVTFVISLVFLPITGFFAMLGVGLLHSSFAAIPAIGYFAGIKTALGLSLIGVTAGGIADHKAVISK